VSKNKVSRAQRDHKTERGISGVGGYKANKTNAMKHFKIQINAISAVSLFYFAQFFGVWRSFVFISASLPHPLPSLCCLLYCYYFFL